LNTTTAGADNDTGHIVSVLDRIKKPQSKERKAIMLARKDQRIDERFVSNAPIIFSLFSSRFWREYPSRTRNHSKDGMCFESSHPLTPGANLFIRVAQHPNADTENSRGAGLRNSTLATVKWCRDLSDAHRICYIVGVRYY
jgi:hypothetical protein